MAAARDGLSPDLLQDEHFRRLIGANTHEGVEYFNKEGFDATLTALDVPTARRRDLAAVAEKSGYRLDRLGAALRAAAPAEAGIREQKMSRQVNIPAQSGRLQLPSKRRKRGNRPSERRDRRFPRSGSAVHEGWLAWICRV